MPTKIQVQTKVPPTTTNIQNRSFLSENGRFVSRILSRRPQPDWRHERHHYDRGPAVGLDETRTAGGRILLPVRVEGRGEEAGLKAVDAGRRRYFDGQFVDGRS